MEEILKLVATYARGMWKYRWPALAVAWVVTAAGAIYVFRMPDVYEGRARVHVDTQSILRPLMAGMAIQPNVQQQVALVSRTLISRPNVEKLVRMADLDLGITTKAEQEQLISELMGDLRIASAGRSGNSPSNLYNLSYRSDDRDKAQRVLEALVSIFVESSLGATRRDQASARAFLDQQIREHEQAMAEAEARLREFQLKHLDRKLEEGTVGAGGPASRVQALSQQIDQTRLQLREAENARDSAKAQMEALSKGNGASASGADGQPAARDPSSIPVSTPEIDARIAAIKRGLDELLLRYTEQHPDVVRSRRLLKELEEQKALEVARLREEMLASPPAAAGDPSASYSPFQQQMGQMVASAEVQVASLRARLGELTTRYNQAVAELRGSPEIEAQGAQLRRDYDKAKRNYEAFVARREKADLSGELEVAPGMAEFRLIEPPRVDPKPVAPNRLALLPVALLAGVVAALVLAFLASQLRPVFHDGSELRAKTQLPLIGIVSAVVSDASRRRHRMELVSFWSASGSLLLLFMAGMAVMAWMANQTV
ncbi:MAG: chain length-determining protein [Rubrivivax sp.]|nr:chain length-determining protein [Rubrivivax sp.]